MTHGNRVAFWGLLPVGMAWWLVRIAVKLPMVIIGFVVMPLMWRYRTTPLDELPFWALPFANPEDWCGGHLKYADSIPDWWAKREGNRNFWTFYKYHAIRNPADGLRNFKHWQLWIDKDKVEYWTPQYMEHYDIWFNDEPGVRGYIVRQGIWYGAKVQWVRDDGYTEFRIGFRVQPRDAHHELPLSSARRHLGASFASKFILNRDL